MTFHCGKTVHISHVMTPNRRECILIEKHPIRTTECTELSFTAYALFYSLYDLIDFCQKHFRS